MLSAFLYTEKVFRKKKTAVLVSLYKKSISQERKIIEKGVKSVRTDAAFSLYGKNDSSGTKNQRFLYLRSTFERMEKNQIKKQEK